MLKSILNKNFKFLVFFYRYLRYRMFSMLGISFLVGALDGLGLTMFIPLLESVSGSNSENSLGNLSVIKVLFNGIGLELNLTVVLFAMLFFFTLKGVAKFFQSYLSSLHQKYFTLKIRNENINALANYKYEAFVNADAGRIQNTLSGEVQRLVTAYVKYNRMLQNAMLLLAYIFLAFLANPEFALLVAIGGVLTNIFFNKLYKRTKRFSVDIVSSNHSFQGLLLQMVAFFKYLKATGSIKHYRNYLLSRVKEIEKTQLKIGFLEAIATGIREPLIVGVVVGVILLSVNVMGETLSSILLSLLLFYRALTAVMAVQGEYNNFLSLSGSLLNIQVFIKELEVNKTDKSSKEYVGFKKDIVINELDFFYGNKTILDRISLTFKKNETIAIVGESGSGKTTLVNVLSGLLKPKLGDILVDDINLFSYNLESYQKRIGYITQEPVIFDDTVFNNVTFMDASTDENIDRCWRALEKASVNKFIKELPNELESRLGNNGINLSGGQKQRISIARELYKDIDFLFMDEATSALDSETEKVIQLNIDQLKGEYTIIIIAHRLSTIKNVDCVIIMNKGKIEQFGNYKQLLKSSPSFQRMVEFQEIR